VGTNIYCNGVPIMREPVAFSDTVLNTIDIGFDKSGGTEELGWPVRRLNRKHIEQLREKLRLPDTTPGFAKMSAFGSREDDLPKLLQFLEDIHWDRNYVPVTSLSRARVVGILPNWCTLPHEEDSNRPAVEILYAIKLIVDFADTHSDVEDFYFYYEESTFGPEAKWDDPLTMNYHNYG